MKRILIDLQSTHNVRTRYAKNFGTESIACVYLYAYKWHFGICGMCLVGTHEWYQARERAKTPQTNMYVDYKRIYRKLNVNYFEQFEW